MTARPPFPPFTTETALQKVQAAEDAWNTRDPERVVLAYTEDSAWRNRGQFITGRAEIIEFLRQKWQHELDYALRKELWGFRGNRELWKFTDEGLMNRREASINDIRIDEFERRIFGPRPTEQRGAPLAIR